MQRQPSWHWRSGLEAEPDLLRRQRLQLLLACPPALVRATRRWCSPHPQVVTAASRPHRKQAVPTRLPAPSAALFSPQSHRRAQCPALAPLLRCLQLSAWHRAVAAVPVQRQCLATRKQRSLPVGSRGISTSSPSASGPRPKDGRLAAPANGLLLPLRHLRRPLQRRQMRRCWQTTSTRVAANSATAVAPLAASCGPETASQSQRASRSQAAGV